MRGYLRKMREERQMSQRAVADSIGHYQGYYKMIESGTRQAEMTYAMMGKLAAAFEVPIQTIIDAEMEYVAKKNSA